MGGIFSGPKMPPVAEAPKPPADDPEKLAKQDEAALLAARRAAAGGRASQVLTSALGDTGGLSGTAASRIFLG